LKKVYGYSQREIAAKLSLSESTVEKHISSGMKRCTLVMRKIQNNSALNKPIAMKDVAGGGHE
jgi:RNA polymerase sigma-70 factor (ECF subfamily)